jgi:gliding motility-associated-like protein
MHPRALCTDRMNSAPGIGHGLTIMVFLMLLIPRGGYAQEHISRDNYTGTWEAPTSWNPAWPVPETALNNTGISVYGYLTATASLSFTGTNKVMEIYDTLVVKGDLTLGSNITLYVHDGAILIVRGNLVLDNKSLVTSDGTFIITGNILKISSINQGGFISNDNPASVFIGGSIAAVGITENNTNYPVLNQVSPTLIVYPGSTYPYGNMTDLANDPVFDFFQSTCLVADATNSGPQCEGNSIQLHAAGGVAWTWSGPGAFSSVLRDPVIPSVALGQGGTYQVSIKDAGGCTVVHTTRVEVWPIPVVPVITTDDQLTFCAGDSAVLKASPSWQYLWSDGSTQASLCARLMGSFSVQAIDTHGCKSGFSVPVSVTVYPKPARPVITSGGPLEICTGASVVLTASAASAYLWSNGLKSRSLSVTETGAFWVEVKDGNGCTSDRSAETAVVVHPLPAVYAGPDTTVEGGTTLTLKPTVSGDGPFSYSWSPPSLLTNAGTEHPTTLPLDSTTVFSLQAASTLTGCASKDDIVVTVSGGPLAANPMAASATQCAGANNHLFALAGGGSGHYSYQWTSNPSGFTSTEANPLVNPDENTLYSVQVYDGYNTVVAQVSVVAYALPDVPDISASGPLTFCSGDSVVLTSSSGQHYLWSTGAETASVTMTTSADVWVKRIDLFGCVSEPSATLSIRVLEVPVRPVVAADGPAVICSGDSLILSVASTMDCLWSTSETRPDITVRTSGTYSLHVISPEGCTSPESVPVHVTVYPSPEVPDLIVTGPSLFCEGDSVVLSTSGGHAFLWSDGSTKPVLVVRQSGTYTVQTADEYGCLSPPSEAMTATVTAVPPLTLAAVQDVMCLTETIQLTATPQGGAFSLVSGPGLIQDDMLTATATGVIQIRYTFSNGCLAHTGKSISVSPEATADAGPDQELYFNTDTRMQASAGDAGSGLWTLVSGTGVIDDPSSPTTTVHDLGAGANILLWTVQSGACLASDEVSVTVGNGQVPSVITPNGDGRNDFFRIAYDGGMELMVVNSWGDLEYQSDHYENDWGGKDLKGRELPEGTYYYLIKLENGTVLKGFIYIKR